MRPCKFKHLPVAVPAKAETFRPMIAILLIQPINRPPEKPQPNAYAGPIPEKIVFINPSGSSTDKNPWKLTG